MSQWGNHCLKFPPSRTRIENNRVSSVSLYEEPERGLEHRQAISFRHSRFFFWSRNPLLWHHGFCNFRGHEFHQADTTAKMQGVILRNAGQDVAHVGVAFANSALSFHKGRHIQSHLGGQPTILGEYPSEIIFRSKSSVVNPCSCNCSGLASINSTGFNL